MKTTRRLSLLVACSGLSLASLQLQAGTVRLYGAEDVPDPRVVASILSGGRWQPPAHGATRGLSISPAGAAVLADGGQDIAEARIDSAAREAVAAWNQRLSGNGIAAPRSTQPAVADKPALVAAASPTATAVAARQAPAAGEPKADRDGTAKRHPLATTMSTAKPSQAASTNQAPNAGALALMVAFANNSARLAPQATRALDSVAEGMKLAGFERRILIEGHANATGKASLNMRLSQLRADAVKRYLVARHGIPGNALITLGYGTEKPLLPEDPAAAPNRRVQFRALDA